MELIDRPRAIMLAETATIGSGIQEYLNELGIPDWETDAESGAEELSEVAGRSCYLSYGTDLNPNVNRVREGNEEYLGKSIIDNGHGSVLEHASVTIAFVGVSRVFTHELVRHRHAAYSQQSLRFIRLSKLMAWYPESFGRATILDLHDTLVKKGILPASGAGKQEWVDSRVEMLRDHFVQTFEYLEKVQQTISAELYLDELDGGFGIKKKITSAMRRLAPIGLGTGVICSANHRAWRHMIAMRTAAGAEEEIRLVFQEVALQLADHYPAIYQDMWMDQNDGSVYFTGGRI